MLKNIIVKSGEIIINVLVVLGLLGSLIAGFTAMSYSFIGGLMTLIGGVAGVVIVAFVVYLLIDIRDNLKQLNNK
jgi:uncharacterized membrane protein